MKKQIERIIKKIIEEKLLSTVSERLMAVGVVLLLASVAASQTRCNSRYQKYIDTYRDVAIYEMLTHGIPASITMAQGLLESGAGESDLARRGNNHFGIKCHDWRGKTMTKDDDERNECFRVYDSPLESFEDHSLFLKRPRYKQLFSLRRTDYKGWARGLKSCGYATNPRYAQLLINIIECYRLDRLDHERKYDVAMINRLRGDSTIDTSLPKKFQQHNAIYEHRVYMNNRNYYVVARKGDTFKSIAKEFKLSYRKLAKYNERDKRDVLSEGDIIYLEKKRSKADKRYKHVPHVVKAGESMYSIAQKYGIQLKSLYRKNHISPDTYSIQTGDELRIY